MLPMAIRKTLFCELVTFLEYLRTARLYVLPSVLLALGGYRANFVRACPFWAKVCHGKKKYQKNMPVWGRGGLELASQNGDVRGAALDSERLRATLGSDDESALRWAQSEFALR